MTDQTPEIEVRWLRWENDGAAILELRRRVFVEEQGIASDIVTSERDAGGIHLGALAGGELVACMSAFLYESGAPELAALELPVIEGLTVQFGKRIELASHRGHGVTEVLGAGLFRYVYECLWPARSFIVLRGIHRGLEDHYRRFVHVERHAEVGEGEEAVLVMKLEGDAKLRALYLKLRAMSEGAQRRCPVSVPSLVHALAQEGRQELFARPHLAAENLYVSPLSLADELPRLAGQNRLLFAEQRPRLAATRFPASASPSLLDVGTGTGVYFSMMAREPAFAGFRAKGLEPSPQMLAYARFAYPDLDLAPGNAYTTGEADASYDVVTANFVFIHLRNPDLALLELTRVLRPGGLLYVVDVNDTTYTGPEVIRTMIEAHHRHHEGDRTILASLPRRAAEFGLEPVQRFRTTVRNTGGAQPAFGPDELRLGRMNMWGMLSFMGQREEIDGAFQAAQEHYLGTECEISMDIETQVFRKPAES